MSAGQLNQLSFKRESTWGTAVVPDKSIPVHFSGGIQTDNDTQMVANARAVLSKNQDAFIGSRKHEGEYEFDLFGDYIGYFLLSALGNISSALKGGESVVYNHTISEQEAKQPLTIEQVIGENVRRYAGAIATGFKISSKAGEIAIMSAAFKAKSQASATKITPAYTTAPAFDFTDAALKIGGVQVTEISNFELEYKNNIEFLTALNNSNDPAFNYVKGSELKGKIDMYLDNTTLAEMTAYLAKTNRALDIVFTGDAIGTSSNYQLSINIPKVVYTAAETKLSDDYNLLSIEFEGLYDTTTSKLLSIVLTNLLTNLN